MHVDVNFLVSLSPDLETSQKLVENEKKCIEELIRERDTLSKVRTCRVPVFPSGVTTANHQPPSSPAFFVILFPDPTNRMSSVTTSINLLFALCQGLLPGTSSLSVLLARCSLSFLTRVATRMPEPQHCHLCCFQLCTTFCTLFNFTLNTLLKCFAANEAPVSKKVHGLVCL